MTRLKRLLGSITFRLALLYTAVFALSVGGLFYFVFWTTSGFAQRQVQAAIEAEVIGFQESYQRSGVSGLVMAVNRRSDPTLGNNGIYLLIDPVGQPMAGNLRDWPRNVAIDDLWVNFGIRDLEGTTEDIADVRALQFFVPEGFRLLVGRDIRDAQQFRRQLIQSLNIGLGATVLVGLLGGFIFGGSVMRRIERITATCRSIMAGDLSQRVAVGRQTDELGRLSQSINAMLDQIERLMKGMQQVSDNIAHDLRTPLNRLRSRLEAVGRKVDNEAARDEIEAALSDADNLLATFAALLRIARAEAGMQRNFVALDLAAIGEDVAEMYQPLAEEKGQSFTARFEKGIHAKGDRNLVAQALANLVDNAIKYTPEGGAVTAALVLVKSKPTFIVSDTGPGIPDEFKGKVLQRLYRMEQSRTSPGSGLGLSLVQAVARSHGLALSLDDNHPGLRVSLAFAEAAPAPAIAPTAASAALPAPDQSAPDAQAA
ncbi:MAG: HAMP domain-containing sensor histidine kinase [Rhodospirillaceae bacterium]|nr:HAMP domain-containing sensor histidine kinase [Rhodospirillaceae bacterium]